MKDKFLRIKFCALTSVAAIISLMITITLFPHEVSAISLSSAASDAIITKAMLAGVQKCIGNTSSTYLLDETYIGAHDLILRDNFASVLFTNNGIKDEELIKLPTQIGNSLNDSSASCSELFLGYKGIGENDLAGFAVAANTQAASKWAEALGYIKTDSPELSEGNSNIKCASLRYKMTSGSSLQTYQTNELCFEVDDKGEVLRENNQIRVMDGMEDTESAGNVITFQQAGGTNLVEFTTSCEYNDGLFGTGILAVKKRCDDATKMFPRGLYDNLNINDLKTDIEAETFQWQAGGQGLCKKESWAFAWYCGEYYDVQSPELIVRTPSESTTDNSNYYKLTLSGTDRLANVRNTAMDFFSNGKYKNVEDAKFNNIDKYNDYTYTLFNLFGIKTDSASGCSANQKDLPNKDLAVKLLAKDGSAIWVQLNADTVEAANSKQLVKDIKGMSNKDAKGKAYVIIGNPAFNGITPSPVSIKDIIDGLNGLDMTGLDVSSLPAVSADSCVVDGVADMPITYNPETPVDPELTDVSSTSCSKLGAGKSLGWILCPILDMAAGAVGGIYNSMVEPFLVTDSEFLRMDDTNGTYIGWKIFQNIANVAAIIMLLTVIFSQVTGVGIDNYGVKKILPKFVVGIVLINLSFIICQLAVDLSNIAGNGLKNMFDGLGTEVSQIYLEGVENTSDGSGVGATILTGGLIADTVAALIAFPGAAAAIASALLPPLLAAVIAMLVAIVMLFVLLTFRKIAVIILIVLAPVAIVMYMLPNTKKTFDKWLKMLGNMLLMYPICGVVIGGGHFVSKLILTSGTSEHPMSFAMALGGMLAAVLPFFFVPTLLKGSMNALGNVGAKLSNFGKGIGNRASNALNNSDKMKDTQRRLGMYRNQKVFDRYQKREQAGKSLSGYQRRRMNNARLAYNNAAREDIAAAAGGAMLEEGTTAYNAALAMQESSVSKQELENQIVAMANDTDNYDVKNMSSKLTKLLSSPTELSHEDEVMMKALMKQLTVKGGFGKKELASVLSGASSATRAQAAKFMSKDGDVAAAVNKNMMVAQYMREVNSGQVAGNVNFDTWQQNNAQRVLTQVITNDTDFANQSASAVKSQLGLLSNERLSAIVNNERVMDAADSEVRDAIIAAAKERGDITIPTRYGGEGAVTGGNPVTSSVAAAAESKDEIPGQMSFVVNDSNELRVHDAGETGKPVDVKIEQPAPKIHVDQVVEQMNNGSRERMQTQGGIILNESPEVQRQLEQEFRQRKDEADRRNDRGEGGIILPS